MAVTRFIPCPICGQPRPELARYPRAVCSACTAQCQSADGRRVSFANVGLSGGLAGRYVDSGEAYPLAECVVRGVGCRAEEAHLGGVVILVAQPRL